MSNLTTASEIESLTQRTYPNNWSDLDTRAVDTARVLAADAVQKVGNGHPGTAMSLAPMAYTLFQRIMRHDPNDTAWVGRDRFVLSCGHSSLTLYIQLYFGGFGVELKDIEALRIWGSLTPGHPEYRHTPGVEITTGPLGQGLASAVGFAAASRYERGLFDPDTPMGKSPFDHYIYVIASDGDIEEGVTSEASSFAGNQQFGNLIVLWDDNKISIEHETEIALGDDTVARYESYGWHVQVVYGGEDVTALEKAVNEAKKVTDKPSFIAVRTIIGYPSPTKMNTGNVHGSALGEEEIIKLKEFLGFDPEKSFQINSEVINHTRKLRERGVKVHKEWDKAFDAWAQREPERKKLFDRLYAKNLPVGWDADLPVWTTEDKPMATRSASGKVINALARKLPELWGGSADLAGSNNTTIDNVPSFGPANISTHSWKTDPYGRVLHFGIREHAMGAILSGITLHGPTRAFGGTFFQFSDYMRPAVRLAALMGISSIYVWTHDSIGLGEDGPTHQPVEHLTALRAIPGLSLIRPADANETLFAWRAIIAKVHGEGPVGLVLTRQNVPILPGTSYEGLVKGAYIISDSTGTPEVILLGSGSEVQLALEAQKLLAKKNISARVISVPELNWFNNQSQEYKDSVLDPSVKARVAVEAGIALSWYRILGEYGKAVSLEHYGASAAAEVLYEKFNITADAVVNAAVESIAHVNERRHS